MVQTNRQGGFRVPWQDNTPDTREGDWHTGRWLVQGKFIGKAFMRGDKWQRYISFSARVPCRKGDNRTLWAQRARVQLFNNRQLEKTQWCLIINFSAWQWRNLAMNLRDTAAILSNNCSRYHNYDRHCRVMLVLCRSLEYSSLCGFVYGDAGLHGRPLTSLSRHSRSFSRSSGLLERL